MNLLLAGRRRDRAHDVERRAQGPRLRSHRNEHGGERGPICSSAIFRSSSLIGRCPSRWLELCRRMRAPGQRPLFVFFLDYATGGKKRYLEAWKRARTISSPSRSMWTTAVHGSRRRADPRAAPACATSRGLIADLRVLQAYRDASEKWESIERYVEARSEAQFSHGYCPECYEKYVRPQLEKS